MKFEIAADSTFFTGLTRIDFEFATDNNQVQGPTTYNRWTIGHDSLWSPQTLSWATDVNSIKMSVLGAPHYDTLVSNIDQPFLGAEPTGPDVKAAQSFLTPPGPLGQQYRLHRVRINARSQYPTHATIDLHADDDGAPGDHLASMIMPGDFAPGELTHVADLTRQSAPKAHQPEPRDTLLDRYHQRAGVQPPPHLSVSPDPKHKIPRRSMAGRSATEPKRGHSQTNSMETPSSPSHPDGTPGYTVHQDQ